MAWLSSMMLLRDFARDGDRLVDAAELEGDVHERRAGALPRERPFARTS